MRAVGNPAGIWLLERVMAMTNREKYVCIGIWVDKGAFLGEGSIPDSREEGIHQVMVA